MLEGPPLSLSFGCLKLPTNNRGRPVKQRDGRVSPLMVR